MKKESYQTKYNKKEEGSLVRMNIILPRTWYNRLEAMKKKEERSLNYFIKKALQDKYHLD